MGHTSSAFWCDLQSKIQHYPRGTPPPKQTESNLEETVSHIQSLCHSAYVNYTAWHKPVEKKECKGGNNGIVIV